LNYHSHIAFLLHLPTNTAEVNNHVVAFVDTPELKGGFLDPSEKYVLKVTEGNLDLLAFGPKFVEFENVALFVKRYRPLVDETNHNNQKKKKKKRKQKKKKQQQPSNDAIAFDFLGLSLDTGTHPDAEKCSIETLAWMEDSWEQGNGPQTSFEFWCQLAIAKRDKIDGL
jgi:hypothetical protein